MAARPKLLIVASDRAMRRSLAFVFEAEGYEVDVKPRLDAELRPPAPSDLARVAIVDEDALTDRKSPEAELARLNRPVILLIERIRRPPALPGLRIIEKPPLGRDLLDAVAAALEPDTST